MDYVAIGRTLYNWAVANSGLLDSQVAWREGNAPRPQTPFVELLLIGPEPVGQDIVTPREGVENGFRLEGVRRFRLSVNVYGRDSLGIITRLQTSLGRPDVSAAMLAGANLASTEISPARDISAPIETITERRMQMDVGLETVERLDYTHDSFDHVTATGSVEDGEIEVEAEAG